MRLCVVCNIDISERTASAKTCSDACREYRNRERARDAYREKAFTQRGVRFCRICEAVIPAEAHAKKSVCSKECRRKLNIANAKSYAEKNPEKHRDAIRRSQLRNREKIRLRQKKYSEDNRDHIREYVRNRMKDPTIRQKTYEVAKARRQKNPEKERDSRQKYMEKYRNRKNELRRIWRSKQSIESRESEKEKRRIRSQELIAARNALREMGII